MLPVVADEIDYCGAPSLSNVDRDLSTFGSDPHIRSRPAPSTGLCDSGFHGLAM